MDIINTILVAIIIQIGSAIKFPVGEVYHGDHFDELVISSKDIFSINTVLVIYGHNCVKDIQRHRLSNQGLPPSNFVILLKYHADKAKELNWLDMDEDQDLKQRYHSSTCLDVMFFKRSSAKYSKPVRWSSDTDQTFVEWLWQVVSVRIGFVNDIHVPLSIHFESLSFDGPVINRLELAVNTKKIVHVYPAYIALFLAKSDPDSDIDAAGNVFVDAKIIKSEAKFLISVPTKRVEKPSVYVAKTKNMQHGELDRYNIWLSEQQKRTLINIYQPSMLPSFRTDGYQVAKMNKEFYLKFVKYYMKRSKSRVEKICNTADAALNPKQYSNNCSFIPIDPSFKEEVLPQIQKYAENFCNCKLKCMSLESIQMYHRDNFVYRSLTEPQQGAITVILQVMKDTHSLQKNPWLMELTLPGGSKMAFDLDMSEALIYESARLIFGRPKPLKAPVHIELITHFVPVSNWQLTAEDILTGILMDIKMKDDNVSEKLKDEL